MDLLDDLRWRGVVFDHTPDLPDALASGSVTAYCGFDPTADSLHVGSLLPLMGLARLQRAGHTPIALVGGGTGLIGDPSGKRAERTLQTLAQVEANVRGIRAQMEAFLSFEGEHAAKVMNNADWLTTIPLTDFLRDVGKHFTIANMTAKESVKSRLDSEVGLSFTEFSYQLLQAYDFLVLHDREGVTLQVGGSDQWGNITAGTDLIRKTRGAKAHGLVYPLIKNAAGTKFGKTEAGTVWLDPERTSPYRFYQFWMRTDDRDVGPYLKAFTWLSREAIEALEAEHAEAPHRRIAQKTLAKEVTEMVHGTEGLAAAERATAALFGGDLSALSVRDIGDVFEGVPESSRPASDLEGEGVEIADFLAEAGATKSKGEARRLVQGGGVRLGTEKVGADHRVTLADALHGEVVVVRMGKKRVHLVRLGR
ncbi:MAG: tyrosine--tRNA ligase [Bacteroidota bacterium]